MLCVRITAALAKGDFGEIQIKRKLSRMPVKMTVHVSAFYVAYHSLNMVIIASFIC